jgi:hypothetical protein
MEYVIFDMDFLEIPFQDYPVDNLVVCHDPQKRLGTVTWAVVKVYSPGSPPDALGLFWEKENAVRFAETFKQEAPK